MTVRHTMFGQTLFATLALCGLLQAQQPPADPNAPAPADGGLLIRTETNLVLVDSVVTDKKGAYVSDLKQKDFKVFEDGKEQPIKSFSYEADPAGTAADRTHYLVLMFDNASMSAGDQIRARQAALKFIDDNAGPKRLMTVVNFGGIVTGGADFTADPKKLKDIVSGLQAPVVRTNGSGPGVDFAIRGMLDSLRSLIKSVSTLPDRKILVLFTGGFPLSPETQAEVTAIVSDSNRANVAIYPVDVRGVMTGIPGPTLRNWLDLPKVLTPPTSVFRNVAFVPAPPFAPQARGGTSSGGSTSSGGGSRAAPSAPSTAPSSTAPSRTATPTAPTNSTGTRTTTPAPGSTPGAVPVGAMACAGGVGGGGGPIGGLGGSPCRQMLIPKIPPTATTNQNVMFMLADGTGGFVIHDDNDFLPGLEKIGKEQNQYYLLGYTPPDTKPGVCHELKVKVDRGGTEVRARTGYCAAKPLDILSNKNPVTKGLEAKIADAAPGKVSGGMRAPFFYGAANVARVNLAMDIATDQLKFEKKKGEFHAQVDLLGIAYTEKGTVAARFSDTVNLDFMDKEDADAAKRLPLHYENQFDMSPGKYTLKVAYNEGGDNYGKLETPLDIAPYASDVLGVSGLALSKQYRKVSEMGGLLDIAMLEDKTPLIAGGLQLVPTGDTVFGKTDQAFFYVEMYEPLLASADPKDPPKMGIRLRVLDRKSGEQKNDSGLVELQPTPPLGAAKVPFAGRIPVTGLAPGAYTFEFTVADSTNKTAMRTVDFDVQ